jgi:phosphoglycolate phosphatase
MRAYKAVAFDYDGTLFDTRPAVVHSIQRTFEDAGRSVPPLDAILSTIASGAALPDTFLILDAVLRRNPATLQERVRAYRAIYLTEGTALLKPFPGTPDTLAQLHDAGTTCVVISNKGVAAIERSLDDNGLHSFVDLVLADAPGLPRKPDPALIIDHVLPKFAQLESRQILMVGDTETDITFAKASGMACCWASYGYGESARCRALAPDLEIAGIAEVPPLVLNRF